MKILVRYFLRGALVLVPVAATVYITYLIITTVDRVLPVGVPGLGFALTLALITLVGFLASSVVGRSFVDIAEKFFSRLPLVKLLYTSVKDLISAFVGDRKRFDRPVAVTLSPESQVKVFGFVTRETLDLLGFVDSVAVYLPQSYNFAGNLIIAPRSSIEVLELPSVEVMTFVVSGGVSGFGMGHSMVPPPPSPDAPPSPDR